MFNLIVVMIENNNSHFNPNALKIMFISVNFFLFSYTSNTAIFNLLWQDSIIFLLDDHFECKATESEEKEILADDAISLAQVRAGTQDLTLGQE